MREILIPTTYAGTGPEFVFPPKAEFNNPITAIYQYDEVHRFTVATKDGLVGEQRAGHNDQQKKMLNPVDCVIQKIQVWHSSCILGFKFYDHKNNVVLESGYFTDAMKEVFLEEGERLLQIRSKHYNNNDPGSKFYHCNLVLVFGKLE